LPASANWWVAGDGAVMRVLRTGGKQGATLMFWLSENALPQNWATLINSLLSADIQ
jgi:hypothetical protein